MMEKMEMGLERREVKADNHHNSWPFGGSVVCDFEPCYHKYQLLGMDNHIVEEMVDTQVEIQQ